MVDFNGEAREADLWRVDRFVRQFGPDYRKLAVYAAVPIVLTPELVGYLRGQFLPGLGWVAEADLLLSELCRPVGYERYVMDAGVQAVLLGELEASEPQQVEVIARRLLGYVRYLGRTNAYVSDRAQKHQQWAAMLCIAEMRGEAIEQITQEFEHWEGLVVEPGRLGVGRSEMVFLEQVLREQMPRMVGNGEYMRLAVRVSEAVGRMNSPITDDMGDRVLVSDSVVIADMAFPPLQEFEFDTVTIGQENSSEINEYKDFDFLDDEELDYLYDVLNDNLDYFQSEIIDAFIQGEHDFEPNLHPGEPGDIGEIALITESVSVEIIDSCRSGDPIREIDEPDGLVILEVHSLELSVKINFTVNVRYLDFESYNPILEEDIRTSFGELAPNQTVHAVAIVNLCFEGDEVDLYLVDLKVEKPIMINLN
ncbi:MAG: hypothetical protein HC860_23585 [Alkalinema sp. RU_4_3]|nr:hypothetical protein [Alkalinema sp. RU_4_3]